MDERSSADQELIAENAALTQRILDLERSAAEGTRAQGLGRDTRAILHAVESPIFVKDNNHRFVLANRACCELFGMEEANVIGQTLAEHIPEHEMQQFLAVDRGVLDTGIPSVREETLTISHVTRTIVTKKTRFIDGSGNKFVMGAIQDITARKEVEGALVRSEKTAHERLIEIEQVYAYSPVGLFVFDRDYRFLRINEYMAAINGCSVADHAGKTLDDIVPELAGFLKEVYRPIFERGEPVLNVPIHGRTPKNSDQRDWIGNYFPLKSSTGEVIGLAAAVLEITAQKRAEHAQQRLADIVERSLNEIYVFACDTLTFSYVNQSARDNLGYALQELTALTPLDLKPEFTEPSFRLLIQPLLAGERRRLDFETLHRRKDGSVYPVAVQLQVVVVADERVFVAVIADITERTQAEADKSALRTQLQQAQKLVERDRAFEAAAAVDRQQRDRLDFLSRELLRAQEKERQHIARELHDEVGQNLTALKINLQLLQDPNGTDPRRIDESISIVNRLLDEIRGLALELRPPLLHEAGLRAAVTYLLQAESERSGLRTQIHMHVGDTRFAPEVELVVFRIIQEAATNAVRHSEARTLTVTLEEDADIIEVVVRDDGIGFEAEHTLSVGTGFGLLSILERAALIGGEARITSAHGAGTTIHARIPVDSVNAVS